MECWRSWIVLEEIKNRVLTLQKKDEPKPSKTLLEAFPRYIHTLNGDGSIDSICTLCFEVIGTGRSDLELKEHEGMHACVRKAPSWTLNDFSTDASKH